MLKFKNEEVILGSLVVAGVLPDMELTGCTVTWGDYPPAAVGIINMDDLTINDTRWWPVLRVERRWLFLLRYTAEIWMGKHDRIIFKNNTFAPAKDREAIELHG